LLEAWPGVAAAQFGSGEAATQMGTVGDASRILELGHAAAIQSITNARYCKWNFRHNLRSLHKSKNLTGEREASER